MALLGLGLVVVNFFKYFSRVRYVVPVVPGFKYIYIERERGRYSLDVVNFFYKIF